MSLLDDIKAKADVNGDGKITKEDLEAIGNSGDDNAKSMVEKLKSLADQNDDGKLTLDDLKKIDVGDIIGDAKDKLGGLFGK